MERSISKSIESLKRDAKRIKKAEGVSHSEALKRVAQREGFPKWELLVKHAEEKRS